MTKDVAGNHRSTNGTSLNTAPQPTTPSLHALFRNGNEANRGRSAGLLMPGEHFRPGTQKVRGLQSILKEALAIVEDDLFDHWEEHEDETAEKPVVTRQ